VKKIALLYGHRPSGHVSAARALEEAFDKLGARTITVDLSRDFYKRSGEAVNGVYLSMLSKAPFLWKLGYDNPLLVSLSAPLRRIFLSGDAGRLAKMLRDSGCDAAVCTHSLPCNILAIAANEQNLPVFGVITDFSAHHFWPARGISGYFVHEKSAADDLAARGIAPEIVHACGIPVMAAFAQDISPAGIRESLRLSPGMPCILICGGSKGLGGMESALRALAAEGRWNLIVACGTNDVLRAKLENDFSGKAGLNILGAQADLAGAMHAADIIVGKPGGVTCAEALAVNKPLIIFDPLPGQEMRNTVFLEKNDAALMACNGRELRASCGEIIAHPQLRQKLLAAQKRLAKPNASSDIAARVLAALGEIPENESNHLPAASN
jgi:processive 1,2-diacylglycerol beta-glucosyltransferase